MWKEADASCSDSIKIIHQIIEGQNVTQEQEGDFQQNMIKQALALLKDQGTLVLLLDPKLQVMVNSYVSELRLEEAPAFKALGQQNGILTHVGYPEKETNFLRLPCLSDRIISGWVKGSRV